MLAIAILLAVLRTLIRTYKFRRLFLDDAFLFLATITLIAGTVLTHLDFPYLYLQVNVELGLESPPPDFEQQLVVDEKLQDAATVLLGVTVFSVKFSFLFFFRGLLRRVQNLQTWWWCVLAVLIPTAGVCICSDFISCPVFGESVLGMPVPVINLGH